MKPEHQNFRHNLIGEILIVVILTSITLLFYFFHIGQRTPIKIGSSYMTMNNEFYPIINEKIANKINNQNDRLYNRDPALDQNKQVEEINSFIHQKVNAIIINPVNGNSTKLMHTLKKAKKAGIKIIVIDSPIKDTKLANCTIVSDNYQAGKLDAEYLLRHQKKGRILLLEHTTAISAVDRIKGFTDTIKQSSYAENFKFVGKLNTYGQSEISMPLVRRAIKQGMKFNIIMALNDRAAVGALAAIDAMNYPERVSVYSVDGSENIKKMFSSNSSIKATVAQSPLTMAEITTNVTYKLIANKTVPKKIIVPVYLITKNNLDQHNISGWQ